jgi:hypothetical protein
MPKGGASRFCILWLVGSDGVDGSEPCPTVGREGSTRCFRWALFRD